MNETTSTATGVVLADVRSLLATHGPISLLEAIGMACAEVADGDTPAEDAELWACAATAAREAADALSGGEDEDEEDEEDEEAAADPEPARDALREEAPTHEETAEAAPTPAYETREEVTTMPKIDALGTRPADATSWRAQFRPGEGEKWTRLCKRGDDGVDTYEWSIRSCSLNTIRANWPDLTGDVVVQYIGAKEGDRRRPCGRSLVLRVRPTAQTAPAPSESSDEVTDAIAAAPRRTAPMRAAQSSAGEGALGMMMGGDAASFFSMLTFLEERSEKARAIESVRLRAEAERAAADSRAQQEQIRANAEMQMERERLASAERIAQIEANARALSRHGGAAAAAALDADALVNRIEQVVDAKVQEALEALEDAAPAAPTMAIVPSAPAGPTEPAWLSKLLELAAPLVPLAVQALQKQASHAPEAAPAAAAGAPFRVVQGGGTHAAE